MNQFGEDKRSRVVVTAYCLLFAAQFVALGLDSSAKFWEHIVGPVLIALATATVAALVAWRKQWAWNVLVALEVLSLLGLATSSASAVYWILAVARIALLLSIPMRRYVAVVPR